MSECRVIQRERKNRRLKSIVCDTIVSLQQRFNCNHENMSRNVGHYIDMRTTVAGLHLVQYVCMIMSVLSANERAYHIISTVGPQHSSILRRKTSVMIAQPRLIDFICT